MLDNLSEYRQSVFMPTAIAADVGSLIRAEMGRQRVNWSELSRRTKISRSSLAHQVNESRVTVDNLVLIAAALGVTPSDLLPQSSVASA